MTTFTIELPDEVAHRLERYAKRRGVTVEDLLVQIAKDLAYEGNLEFEKLLHKTINEDKYLLLRLAKND